MGEWCEFGGCYVVVDVVAGDGFDADECDSLWVVLCVREGVYHADFECGFDDYADFDDGAVVADWGFSDVDGCACAG